MTLPRTVKYLTFALSGWLLVAPVTLAEDTKGKWQFGFGLSYYSITDYIRSNADIAISSGVVGENGLPPVAYVDERPDINILNEPSVADDFKIDVNASYGLTRWLAVEMSASYYKSDVGNIEYFFRDQTTFVTSPSFEGAARGCGADPVVSPQPCWGFSTNSPVDDRVNSFVPVGVLTTMPVHLSGLVRFRPESPLDPYVGLGVGYIFADLKQSAEFTAKSQEIDDLFVAAGDKGDVTQATPNPPTRTCGPNRDQLCANFDPGGITAEVDDNFQWQAIAGIDYYMSERFSFYVDARYAWTSGSVDIRIDGDPQVRFAVNDAGQIILCSTTEQRDGCPPIGTNVNPYWEDTGFSGCSYVDPVSQQSRSCAGDNLLATEDKFGGNGPDTMPGTEDDGPPVQNGLWEQAEDDGYIYLLPPNTRDLKDAVRVFCPACVNNGAQLTGAFTGRNKDTEDKNGNGALDSTLIYGVDICTTPAGAGHPRCTSGTTNDPHYIWPAGCATRYDASSLLPQPPPNASEQTRRAILATITNQGCPPIPATGAIGGTTATDDASDLYIVQGGDIRLGGFSLGLGMKFMF